MAGNITLTTNGVVKRTCGITGMKNQLNNSGTHLSTPIKIPSPIITAETASGDRLIKSTIFAARFFPSVSSLLMHEAIVHPIIIEITRVTTAYIMELSNASDKAIVELSPNQTSLHASKL